MTLALGWSYCAKCKSELSTNGKLASSSSKLQGLLKSTNSDYTPSQVEIPREPFSDEAGPSPLFCTASSLHSGNNSGRSSYIQCAEAFLDQALLPR